MSAATDGTDSAVRSMVFMPLRSNAAWFESPDTRATLERQVKINLMLHDRIIFQNGRWQMTAGYDGQGMEFPPGFYPWEPEQRRHISYCAKGSPFGIQIGSTPILQSTAETSWTADFYPILYDAGLLDTACYDWHEGDSTLVKGPEIERAIDQIIKDCEAELPANHYTRRRLVEGLIKDALLAQRLKLPMTVDYQVAPFVLKHHQSMMMSLEPEMRRRFYDHWATVELPDFGDYTWEEIIDARESQAGIAFRQMVARVCNEVRQAITQGAGEQDIDQLIGRAFTKELVSELVKRRKTPTSTAFGMLLNLVPFGGVIDAARDALELGKEGDSWFGVVGLEYKPK